MSDEPTRARQEYAANAILEDSRLRGEMSDEEYAPLQAEALAYVDRRARETGGLSEEAARKMVDEAIAEAKERIRTRSAAPRPDPGRTPPSITSFARFLRGLRLRL